MGGNVGIGTTSPTSSLTVYENSSNGGIMLQGVSGVNSGNADLNIYTASANGKWDISANNTAGLFTLYDGVNAKTPFSIEPNAATDSLYIKSGGNVGIGTTSPASKLDIEGGNFTVGNTAAIVQTPSTISLASTKLYGNGTGLAYGGAGMIFIQPTANIAVTLECIAGTPVAGQRLTILFNTNLAGGAATQLVVGHNYACAAGEKTIYTYLGSDLGSTTGNTPVSLELIYDGSRWITLNWLAN